MAFKMKSTDGTLDFNKAYFWNIHPIGQGLQHYAYVTADTAAAIEISGYFSDAQLVSLLKPGDLITVWSVDAIVDTRHIRDDMFAGLNAIYQTVVMANDGSGVQVAPLSEKWSLEYTLP
jgi:hypothetical protein